MLPSNLFLIVKNIRNINSTSNYAINNTFNDSGDAAEAVLFPLKNYPDNVFNGFYDNQMKRNTKKYLLIMNNNELVDVQLIRSLVVRSNCEKLLGV